MKKFIVMACLLSFAVLFLSHSIFAQEKSDTLEGRITLSGAWALYPMAVKWAEEFQKLYPKVKIDISAGGAGKGMVDCLSKIADIGMVSRDINPEELKKGAWAIPVTKDAVVPTVNANNPAIQDLLAKGVTKEIFQGIFVTGEIKTWDAALEKKPVEGEVSKAVNVYTRSDACGAAETWAKYLGKKQEDLVGIGVYGDPGVAEAVKKDTLGIGYNNINYAYDTKTHDQISGVRVIPIDVNEDGSIDENENFYADLNTLTLAIAEGRYPSPPARELYFVSGGKPERREVKAFLRWVLTDGQKFVPENGYVNIAEKELMEALKKLE